MAERDENATKKKRFEQAVNACFVSPVLLFVRSSRTGSPTLIFNSRGEETAT